MFVCYRYYQRQLQLTSHTFDLLNCLCQHHQRRFVHRYVHCTFVLRKAAAHSLASPFLWIFNNVLMSLCFLNSLCLYYVIFLWVLMYCRISVTLHFYWYKCMSQMQVQLRWSFTAKLQSTAARTSAPCTCTMLHFDACSRKPFFRDVGNGQEWVSEHNAAHVAFISFLLFIINAHNNISANSWF